MNQEEASAQPGFPQSASDAHGRPYSPEDTPLEPETRILPQLEPATQIMPAPPPGPARQSAGPRIVYVEAPERSGGWRQVGCSILLALTIFGCALLLIGGTLVGRAFVDTGNQFDAATSLVVSFCGAEGDQNFAQAYSYFSPAFRKKITLDQFIQRSLDVTQKSGAISQCEIDPTSNPQQSGATFTVDIDVSRSDNSATTGTVYLVSDGHGGWLIDSVASPLGLF